MKSNECRYETARAARVSTVNHQRRASVMRVDVYVRERSKLFDLAVGLVLTQNEASLQLAHYTEIISYEVTDRES